MLGERRTSTEQTPNIFRTFQSSIKMLFAQAALFVTSAGAAALAPPVQVATRSDRRAPAAIYNTISLDDFDPALNNNTLGKRQAAWSWCAQEWDNACKWQQSERHKMIWVLISFLTVKCAGAASAVTIATTSIARLIVSKSSAQDCSYSSGETNGIAYQVHATGANCDTTAQESTIEGGLNTYFEAHGNAVCDVHCVSDRLSLLLLNRKARSLLPGSSNPRRHLQRLPPHRSLRRESLGVPVRCVRAVPQRLRFRWREGCINSKWFPLYRLSSLMISRLIGLLYHRGYLRSYLVDIAFAREI